MKHPIHVAALQMNSINNLDSNLNQAYELFKLSHAAGAELIVLPEYFAWMGLHDTDKLALAEIENQGIIQNFLCHAAQEFSFWIVGGTLPIQSPIPNKVFNRCLIVNPDGEIAWKYDKIHLFSFDNGQESYCESNTILAGQDVTPLETNFGRISAGICYDLRFPEFFRIQLPVDIFALPAAFTWTTGHAHWNTLLAARAIENQSYIIASAQTGIHPSGRRTFGHSQIIDPWGEVLACKEEGVGIITAQLDPKKIEQIRKNLPALQHRYFINQTIKYGEGYE